MLTTWLNGNKKKTINLFFLAPELRESFYEKAPALPGIIFIPAESLLGETNLNLALLRKAE